MDTTKNVNITCRRCGNCCYYLLNGRKKKCKYLVIIGSTTLCRVYNNRLGRLLDEDYNGDKIYCLRISELEDKPLGCAYNKKF